MRATRQNLWLSGYKPDLQVTFARGSLLPSTELEGASGMPLALFIHGAMSATSLVLELKPSLKRLMECLEIYRRL
jgi:hypothetical protein